MLRARARETEAGPCGCGRRRGLGDVLQQDGPGHWVRGGL